MYDPTASALVSINGEPGLGQWTEVAPLATPRSRVALAASGGRLYAIGKFFSSLNRSPFFYVQILFANGETCIYYRNLIDCHLKVNRTTWEVSYVLSLLLYGVKSNW